MAESRQRVKSRKSQDINSRFPSPNRLTHEGKGVIAFFMRLKSASAADRTQGLVPNPRIKSPLGIRGGPIWRDGQIRALPDRQLGAANEIALRMSTGL
jgi:hypothetical protein